MSRREAFYRHGLIVQKLRNRPSSFKEIETYLKEQSELWEYDLQVSKRTFDRDRNEIRSIYNIDIEWNQSMGYYIEMDQNDGAGKMMLESFETFNALNISGNLKGQVHFSDHYASGSENLYGLLHSIRNRKIIKFKYTNYWEVSSNCNLTPIALKEHDYRWYLIGVKMGETVEKVFGLDRISDLEITKSSFPERANQVIHEMFDNSYGIYNTKDIDPVKIELVFTAYQGKYLKNQPLHHSQKILRDYSNEFRIEMNLCITDDFIMKLLWFGDAVRVMKPSSLAEEMKKRLRKAIEQYHLIE